MIRRISVPDFSSTVSNLERELDQLFRRGGYEPAIDGPAIREAERFGDVETMRTVLGQSFLLRESAGEHARAALQLLSEPFHVFSGSTCVRTAMEVSSLICWLLDPSINERERAARGVAWRRKGLDEQSKLIRDAPHTGDGGLAKRYEQVDAKIRRFGLEAVRVPSATELVGRTFGRTSYYRIGSAVVHGHSWALSQIGFEVAGREAAQKTVFLNKTAKPEFILYLLILTLESIAKPAWDLGCYLGRRSPEVSKLLETAYDDLQMTGDRRFWRGAS